MLKTQPARACPKLLTRTFLLLMVIKKHCTTEEEETG